MKIACLFLENGELQTLTEELVVAQALPLTGANAVLNEHGLTILHNQLQGCPVLVFAEGSFGFAVVTAMHDAMPEAVKG